MTELLRSTRATLPCFFPGSLAASLAVVIALSLSSCGFALRGSVPQEMATQELQLNAVQPNSSFNRILREMLASAGVEVRTAELPATAGEPLPPRQADYILIIGEEETSSRTATINSRARAAQYDLRMSISFTLNTRDETLIGPRTLSVERRYAEDITNVSGSNEEVELLQAEMRRELASQLLRQLQALQ